MVGRIDQIVAMRQQLADPNQAASTGATGSGTAAAGAGSSGTPASFSDALNSALGTSVLGTSALGTSALGTSALATAGAPPTTGPPAQQVQAMTDMANSLVGKLYVYGGGHSGWGPQSGYDCSGFVSAVLHAGGYLSQPVDTTANAAAARDGIRTGAVRHRL
jgi:cell wall-associated NlpC family hydrolase